MDVGVLIVHLFQPPRNERRANSGKWSAENVRPSEKMYRGSFFVPYFTQSTTMEELMNGIEFRLNSYAVGHNCDRRDKKKGAPRAHQHKQKYFCENCNNVQNAVTQAPQRRHTRRAADEEEKLFTSKILAVSVMKLFALTSVPKPTRGGEWEFAATVAAQCDVENKVGEFARHMPFYKHATVASILPRDVRAVACTFAVEVVPGEMAIDPSTGIVSRVPKTSDHMVLHSNVAGPKQIEVTCPSEIDVVGTFSVTVDLSDPTSRVVEEVEERWSRVVRRLFDRATNAALLPCDTVGYVMWAVSSLCVELYPPDVVAPPVARAVRRHQQLDEFDDNWQMLKKMYTTPVVDESDASNDEEDDIGASNGANFVATPSNVSTASRFAPVVHSARKRDRGGTITMVFEGEEEEDEDGGENEEEEEAQRQGMASATFNPAAPLLWTEGAFPADSSVDRSLSVRRSLRNVADTLHARAQAVGIPPSPPAEELEEEEPTTNEGMVFLYEDEENSCFSAMSVNVVMEDEYE